jgi:predicted RNA-binding Zn-ribbon protein involved in translation (DUF1610 family)
MLDEYQLMNEDTWAVVGAPMLLDNNGDAIFIYTPPSLHSRSASKANNPRHASELYEQHEHDKDKPDWDGRWECFHFTSHDNPHLSKIALSELTKDMTALAIRQEIDAEDANEAPGALWKRRGEMVGDRFVRGIEDNRVFKTPFLIRVVVGVDPSGSSTGDACGIVGAGIDAAGEHYTLEDNSVQGSPDTWARNACQTYHKLGADAMAAEKNYGGEMVEKVIHDTDPSVNVILVTATRGKAIRAEPVSALTERGKDHMVGTYPELEDEMCLWVPSDKSPNRMDAKVWADTELGARPPASKLVDFASNEVTIKTDEERTLDIQHQSAGRVCPQCGKADFVHLTASGVYACAMCGIAVPERVEKVEVIP